ncbi:FKBP-type peptidyl-prolyl cis-trans isomerase [Litorihabitans aurantiacus]|uniref:Peptidyl-prolyl cis-trans isomerase n=1 Tax=Litorihabitans aurantiacus TaxID=1930061 RepID=A0AA38CNS5_9MICO|nr:peptidylprolyl isomerase [Litorihabitans aurantiacus]
MRLRLPALTATALAAALLLGACGSDDGGGGGEASGGDSVGFTASGEFGEKPTLEFTSDEPSDELEVEVVSEGDGAEVAGTDTVEAHYLGQVFGTETVFDNSYDRGAPTSFPLTGVIPGWTQGLTGQKVGSRVLLSIPSELGYPNGQGEDIKAGDTIVFVVDIVDADAGPDPDGVGQADAEPTGAEVPVTVEGDLGAPITGVTVTEGATPPTEESTTVLATGTGEPLAAGDSVDLQYFLTTWDNAETETTWPPDGVGVQRVTLDEAAPPFNALIGTPAGSRVLIQVPGDEAMGAPALAVVLDIVAE